MCVHVYVGIGGQVCVHLCVCVGGQVCVCVGVDGQVEKGMCGPQQCTGGSLVFVHRMVPEIDVFFLIPFSIVSCLVEAIRLVKGINNNSSILRTTRCTTTNFHLCAAEGPHIPLISAS